MAESSKYRDNSITKREDETDLYRLLNQVVHNLKQRYTLRDHDVKESALDLRHSLMSKEWRSPCGIDYDNISLCCGYLKRYAISHAGLTRLAVLWFLKKIPPDIHKFLFRNDSLNVVSVGGGPGNDLLGFCCAIEGIEKLFRHLKMTVIDFKGGWEIVFDEVMSVAQSLEFGKVGKLLEDENIEIDTTFVQADLYSEEADELKNADLVLMVKVLSNISGASKRKTILKNIFSKMKENSVFLCIDTDALKVCDLVDCNMGIICTKKCHKFHISLDKTSLRNVAQKSTYEVCASVKREKKDECL